MAEVDFTSFLNKGSGLFKRPLGDLDAASNFLNAVELQFSITSAARKKFKKMKVIQWSGPEAIWCKEGALLESPWKNYKSGLGSGDDSPEPENTLFTSDGVAMYDNPGMTLPLAMALKRYTAVYIVQNFTTWIDTDGGNGVRIGPTAGWHSMLLLANTAPSAEGTALPAWGRFRGLSSLGWLDHRITPKLP